MSTTYRKCSQCEKTKDTAKFRLLDAKKKIYSKQCLMCLAAKGAPDTPASRREQAERVQIEEQYTRELASREIARRRLINYTERFEKNYMTGWFHRDVAARLERFVRKVELGLSPRLMLMAPPRIGKSKLVSENLPSFVLGHHPEWEIINASYAASLPQTFSKRIRERMRSKEYRSVFKDTHLDPDNQGVDGWFTTAGGGYLPAGVGGSITGRGAHILAIDDPFKDREEADSEVIRRKVMDWYSSTAYTRLYPGAGVLIMQCMTGDTPVLMANGMRCRLDQICVGDEVATYDDGKLSTSIVQKWKNNGCDSVFKITTISGKVVRANGRHPFLVNDGGELKWIRTKHLTTAHTIVAVRDSAESGLGSSAPSKVADSPSVAAATALPTTAKRNGRAGTAPRQATPSLTAPRISSTATASPLMSTLGCSLRRAGSALSVAVSKLRRIGVTDFASTTATTPAKSAACSATDATSLSVISEPSGQPWLLWNTCDFTLDRVVSVEPDGEADVFDVQIERTENFIANGLVSHNTRWHDADLIGSLISLEEELRREGAPEEEIENWEIVSYPSIAEEDEYIMNDTYKIVHEAGPNRKLMRKTGEALHPERYDIAKLRRVKRNMQPRDWIALHQQRPQPSEGEMFRSDYKRTYVPSMDFTGMTPMIAGDLAIGQKQINDYTVLVAGYLNYNGDVYVVDMIRGRLTTFGISEAICAFIRKYSPHVGYIEYGQLWLSILPVLREMMDKDRLFISWDEDLKPTTDKVARARPLEGHMQQGRVYFPQSQPWVDTAMHELLRFPNGVHDDCVDALAWLLQLARKTALPRSPAPRKLKSWRDKLAQYAQGQRPIGYMAS